MKRLYLLLIVLLLAGCATTGGYSRLPDQVTEWLEHNTWRVEAPKSGGTGFWFNGTFITACHIVEKFPVAYIHNIDRTEMTLANVSSCDSVYDIAVLTPTDHPNNMTAGFEPYPIKLADEMPRPGTLVYSAGWETGGPLGFSYGVLNSKSDYGYEAAMQMVYGDSGSPALALRDGQVELIGIMISFTMIRKPTGDIPVFGSSTMVGAEAIRAALEKYET